MDTDRCVCCGDYVPEGTMVCKQCLPQNKCLMCGAPIPEDKHICDECEDESSGILPSGKHIHAKRQDTHEMPSPKKGKHFQVK